MDIVLIADDHEIVRRGIRMIIEGFGQKYHIIEATTCTGVMDVLTNQDIYYTVLDLSLADGNLFSSFQQLSAYCHRTHMLVYTMNPEKIYAKRLIEKGVRGFLSKLASMEELEKAIDNTLRGELYLSPLLKEKLTNPSRANMPDNPIDTLSDRELEVVEYMTQGIGTKEIAKRLKLDITTISTYRRRVFEKMEVENTIELKDKFLWYRMDRK